MKLEKHKLEQLRIKSFITTIDAHKSFTIKGAGTEDNTAVQGSFTFCKEPTVEIDTEKTTEISTGDVICFVETGNYTD